MYPQRPKVEPRLEPCRKFRKVSAKRFVEHIREGKCGQCSAFFRQLDKEQRMMTILWESRN
jgi:hypothetical protein